MLNIFRSWQQATVTRWLKGYGFATRGSKTKDVFIHASVLPRRVKELASGQKIDVKVGRSKKGPQATKLRLRSN